MARTDLAESLTRTAHALRDSLKPSCISTAASKIILDRDRSQTCSMGKVWEYCVRREASFRVCREWPSLFSRDINDNSTTTVT